MKNILEREKRKGKEKRFKGGKEKGGEGREGRREGAQGREKINVVYPQKQQTPSELCVHTPLFTVSSWNVFKARTLSMYKSRSENSPS